MKHAIHFFRVALLCSFFFLGNNCSNPCSNTNCLNGGTCVEGECQCPPGYYGAECQFYDPCFNVRCLNGGQCEDGNCICPTGYTGNNCDVKLTPRGVRIRKVVVTQFPARKINGFFWDQGEEQSVAFWPADLFVRVRKNDQEINLSYYVSDCQPNQDYSLTFANPLIFQPLEAKCTILLYDFDHQLSSDDLIAAYFFYFSRYTDRYPARITLYNPDTWHQTKMEVYVEWLF